ncbi:beta-lactamase-like protein [Nemania sp. FL0916]|nr:beta-lactamase-like protein [Nemania sp. FL0916]
MGSVYVTISALDAGHITLPDYLFVAGSDPDLRTTVPSLSFLIQHPSSPPSRTGNVTNLIFDLGVKRDLSGYAPAQQPHVAQRTPIITDPDCSASLRNGVTSASEDEDADGEAEELLNPETDIDFVILSHVHWDHIGTPSDFPSATFIVGSGTLGLLKNGGGQYYPAELFNADELPAARTVELPPAPTPAPITPGDDFRAYYAAAHTPAHTLIPSTTQAKLPPSAGSWSWQPFSGFPRTIDIFNDHSVYVIDSPGHIFGHINLLLRTGARKYVFLGGDCCHDTRILDGSKDIAEYDDGKGGVRSVHTHTELAKRTLVEIEKGLESLRADGVEVEVVLAHDRGWRDGNRQRFWPGKM